MSGTMFETGSPVNLTASGAISLRPGYLLGFYVNTTSSGTLVIKDGGSSGTALTGTITPAIGFHRFPAAIRSATGAYATIGATLDVTFFFAAG